MNDKSEIKRMQDDIANYVRNCFGKGGANVSQTWIDYFVSVIEAPLCCAVCGSTMCKSAPVALPICVCTLMLPAYYTVIYGQFCTDCERSKEATK